MTKPRYSASQVTEFLTCPRKWWWRYIKGIKPPQKAAAALGERVHKILEEYQKYAVPPNRREAWQFQGKGKAYEPGKIALEALPYIPKPKTAVTEEWFEIETKETIWIGVIDLQWEINVLDYKTTSSVQYIKTEENLIKDPQVILYSAKNFLDKPSLNEIIVKWLYLITRGKPKAKEIKVKISRSQSELGLEWLEKVAAVMTKVAQVEDINTIKSRAESCQLFGECFFTKKCNLTNQERIRSIMSNDLAADLQGDALEDLINAPEKSDDSLDDLLEEDETPTTTQAPSEAVAKGDYLDDLLADDDESITGNLDTKVNSGDDLDDLLADDKPTTVVSGEKFTSDTTRQDTEDILNKNIPTFATTFTAEKDKFTLCIDCSPTKFQGQMMTLSELIEPYEDLEKKEMQRVLRKNLKAAPINPKTVLVTNSLDSKEYIQILEASAGMVIRG